MSPLRLIQQFCPMQAQSKHPKGYLKPHHGPESVNRDMHTCNHHWASFLNSGQVPHAPDLTGNASMERACLPFSAMHQPTMD